jgi:hypothetical protein
MGKRVTIPLSFLEDIFRLLDVFRDLEGLDFFKCGYNTRIEYDNVIWELKIKIQKLQCHLMETYLLSIGDITRDEKRALYEWVGAGNSVYCNPGLICDDSGRMMDFINGCRVASEMAEDPLNFYGEVQGETDNGGWDDDLPF